MNKQKEIDMIDMLDVHVKMPPKKRTAGYWIDKKTYKKLVSKQKEIILAKGNLVWSNFSGYSIKRFKTNNTEYYEKDLNIPGFDGLLHLWVGKKVTIKAVIEDDK